MMELRWVKLKISDETPAYAIPIAGQLATEFRVLQYRVDIGMRKPIWSEWMDVPFETD